MKEQGPHLLQEGSYGCAFTPSLPCKKSKARSKAARIVGKIIKKENAEVELSIGTLIRGIEGWSNYYIIQEEDDCTKSNFTQLRKEYAQQCKLYRKSSDSKLTQLLSPYGGTPLRLYGITASFNFIDTLRHMLEGVAKLNEQGICHFDLHEGNILVDTNDVCKVIDFGSAFIGDQLTEEDVMRHTYSFSPEFPPQTPEFAVQNGIVQGLTISYSIEETIRSKAIFTKIQGFFKVSMNSQREELKDFWSHQMEWKGNDAWVSFYKTYWRKCDSWAIGILFFELLYKYIVYSSIQKQWNQNYRVITDVLKGCLHADPRKRLTAMEALALLNSGYKKESSSTSPDEIPTNYF